MKIDMQKLVSSLNIPSKTEGDHHCTEGWIQFKCPFCNDSKYHLGFNSNDQKFNCFACGYHKFWEVLPLISGRSVSYLRTIIPQFTLGKSDSVNREVYFNKELKPNVPLQDLDQQQCNYLRKRRYVVGHLQDMYGVQGTHRLSRVGSRIFIPIIWDGVPVSYVLRSITEDEPRYLKCPKEKEVYPARSVLYGWNGIRKRKCVVVEGIFDMWRLGPGAVATMGLGYSPEQVRLLSTLDEVFILFDNDKPGKQRTHELASKLSALTDVTVLQIDAPDPDSLSQKEADDIMQELRLR